MPLTAAQITTLTADLAANTATVTLDDTSVVQIKDVPKSQNNAGIVAAWYAKLTSVAYWVWKTNLTESEVYDTTSDVPTTWSWSTYKAQAVPEQGAWSKMFMGGNTNFSHLNNRVGVDAIFGGPAPGNAQRAHTLAVGRRLANNGEKLFAVAVASPPANTGNDGVAGNRGKVSNPDVMAFEGSIATADISAIWGV